MSKVAALAFSLLIAATGAFAATVEISWPTSNASPALNLPPQQAEWLPAFRAGLALLPESAIISMALSQPKILGLPPEDSRKLGPLIAAQYELIATDTELSAARSHLAYCFSASRPTHGLARLSYPERADANTPVLVFLHGSGGSFLWYHRWIRATFPNHIVISPAYGTNTAFIPPAYLREAQQQAARALGHPLAKPMLIGLSAGGFGAARAYASSPSDYQAAVILAAYPPPEILGSTDARHDLRFLAGGDEFYIRDGTWKVALGRVKKRGVRIAAQVIPAAGHFFILTHEAEAREWLAAQLSKSAK